MVLNQQQAANEFDSVKKPEVHGPIRKDLLKHHLDLYEHEAVRITLVDRASKEHDRQAKGIQREINRLRKKLGLYVRKSIYDKKL